MRALYISQNGMAENLGQSQVLPYVRGLARRGVEFDLVSFELASLTDAVRDEIAAQMQRDGIHWHPLERTMRSPLHVKVAEAGSGVRETIALAARRRPDIVHGRSYFATAIADATRQVSRSKLLFDCRGMIGDEYVDCGYWTKERIEYRLVKAYERRLFTKSDGIVVLTRALAAWLRENELLGRRPALEVVPCCVDLEKFKPAPEARARVRAELGLREDQVAITYSGSLGTWYLEPDMVRFAAALRRRLAAERRAAAFVCFTPSDASGLTKGLHAAGFAENEVVVRKVAPKSMAEHLAVADVGLSFIQSCFSKKGSSPTKVAEYLAVGAVTVVNGDIGDQADLASERDACVVLPDFADASIERAAEGALALLARPREARVAAAVDVARRHFGLEEVGVARYARLYETLARG